jgi:hypothetical protein
MRKLLSFGIAALSLGLAANAYAFHSGGVAECDGCHTMHNSEDNAAMGKGPQFQGNPYLLQGSDASSTCLICHGQPDTTASGYHIMTTGAGQSLPVERTPGGDFAWITQTFTGTVRGNPVTSPGERHGHNVVAADFGLVADSVLTKAPGGTYDATALSCISCHDPHSRARITDAAGTIVYPTIGTAVKPIGASGSYPGTSNQPTANQAVGVYRLLAGANYSQMSYSNTTPFTANPPTAIAPSTYNRTEAVTDTRVAYGAGMSEWCANCHKAIHNDVVHGTTPTTLIHPAGNGAVLSATANDLVGNAAGTTIAALYNAYKKSGDLTGTQASSYDSLVPYEEGTTDRVTLSGHAKNDGSVTTGPSTGAENVMCLSCHRAHASGFSSMTRWSNVAELIAVDGEWPGTGAVSANAADAKWHYGMTQAQYKAAMYDKPASRYAYAQRSLCNKCHAKD